MWWKKKEETAGISERQAIEFLRMDVSHINNRLESVVKKISAEMRIAIDEIKEATRPVDLKTFVVCVKDRKPIEITAELQRHYFNKWDSASFEIKGKTVASFMNVDSIYEKGTVKE